MRRDSGDDWREYLRKLYRRRRARATQEETGKSDPDDEELRRFDKGRKNKRVSNEQWVSASDPDARIGRMKDGRTHLKYKAEHAVDLDTQVILAAEVYPGDYGDTLTIEDTVMTAQTHLSETGIESEIEEVVADKGYHSEDAVDRLQNTALLRTYIPKRERKKRRSWKNKSARRQAAHRRNRRNTRGTRAAACSAYTVNVSNAPSLICATRAGHVARGFAGWRTSRSDTSR